MSMPGRCNLSQHKQALPNGWDAFWLRRTQDSLPSSTKVRSFQSQAWEGKGRPRRGSAKSTTPGQPPAVFKGWKARLSPEKGQREKCPEKQGDWIPELVQMLPVGLLKVCRAKKLCRCRDGTGVQVWGSAAPQSHREKMLQAPPISPLNTPKGRGITSLTDQNLRHWLKVGANGQGHSDKMCAVWGSLLPASKWESGPAASRLLHQ